MDANSQAESLVRRLPGVAACRIELDAGGRVQAVHVTVTGSPPPGLAADVATLLETETDLRVDPSRVHVLPGGGDDAPDSTADAGPLEFLEVDARPVLIAMRTSTTLEATRAEVELALGNDIALGIAETRGAAPAVDLLAHACLDALEKLCGARVSLRLLAMQRTTTGPLEVVTVVVQEDAGRDVRLHTGAARNDGDLARAAAYAALDSMNRRFGRILALPPRTLRIV